MHKHLEVLGVICWFSDPRLSHGSGQPVSYAEQRSSANLCPEYARRSSISSSSAEISLAVPRRASQMGLDGLDVARRPGGQLLDRGEPRRI